MKNFENLSHSLHWHFSAAHTFCLYTHETSVEKCHGANFIAYSLELVITNEERKKIFVLKWIYSRTKSVRLLCVRICVYIFHSFCCCYCCSLRIFISSTSPRKKNCAENNRIELQLLSIELNFERIGYHSQAT